MGLCGKVILVVSVREKKKAKFLGKQVNWLS